MAMVFQAHLPRSVPGSSLNGPIIATLFKIFSFRWMECKTAFIIMQITAQQSTDPE